MKPFWSKKTPRRGFLRNREGASAIEFAIVGGPFLLLLIGLFDIGLIYAGNTALDQTVAEAGRFIRTGQAQQWGEAAFRKRVCEELGPLLSCQYLHFDVRTFDNFQAAQLTDPFDNKGKLKEQFSYDPGTRNEVVVVRAFYEWPILKNFPVAFGFGNSERLLVATAAFRNEPF
ncbi:TadE-like protein [Methyloligella halotolerans]|uniref:TadE-like protein n=1 Tax=Methyloligella halotolerans TaxID=1177755 RepID=A0A1E2RW50_9HYPH|nr:TadE/TadG family type IV pilus assembly protein [Methyloligella halotolerans]ODA66382.1 TadE-like protein [Methyloligella halotolerans]